jgi:hypothetical protein
VSDTVGRDARVSDAPNRTSMPSSAKRSATRAPAHGSFLSSSAFPRTIIVTSAPNARSHTAASQATTPPPTMATLAGTSCRFVTSREIHGRASRSPGTSGTAAVVPVASTTACLALSTRSPPPEAAPANPPPDPFTVISRSPLTRPRPRTTSMPTDRAHSTCEVSSCPAK